jgi:hypothetical protein
MVVEQFQQSNTMIKCQLYIKDSQGKFVVKLFPPTQFYRLFWISGHESLSERWKEKLRLIHNVTSCVIQTT